MRNIVFVPLCLLLISCGPEIPLTHIDRNVELTGFDFTKYSALGFLYTPYRYDRDYQSIGMLNLTAMPEANLIDSTKVYSSGFSAPIKRWRQEKISVALALDSLYQKALRMGADAIVDLQIGVATEQYTGARPVVVVYGYKITGFAIKRAQK